MSLASPTKHIIFAHDNCNREIKEIKKLKKIKTNEVCHNECYLLYHPIENDNATIVFIFFNFFISFISPK